MGKEVGRFYKHDWSKIYTLTLKKPVFLSSASRASSASNSAQTYISSRLDNKHITNNQNKNNISNTDDILSCVTPCKNIYSVQATYAPTHLNPLNATLPISSVELYTPIELPSDGK